MTENKVDEFRQDLVSGEWVLLSNNRTHSIRKFEDVHQSKEECPFEDLEKSGQEIIRRYPDNDDWRVTVIKNKFPAVQSEICTPERKVGPFHVRDGVGQHHLFIYRDHEKQLNQFNPEEMSQVLLVFKQHKKEMKHDVACIKYVSLFHNFGSAAGASIYHPHSQILSLPILPPRVSRSLHGASRFFQKNGEKVYDKLIELEMKQKTRVVYENEHFIAFCPFAADFPYEVQIFPKDSTSHFVNVPDNQFSSLGQALSIVLGKLRVALGNPAFNFFIHTAPIETELANIQDFYTWHIEILPKVKVDSGFELGTGIELNVVDPDDAAQLLRETNVN